MTIIADRGLFVRILTASGKVGAAEAEAYADALDGASKDPATKADIAELRAEIALLAQRVESGGKRADERMDELGRRLIERMEVQEKRLSERLDAQEKRSDARTDAAGDRQMLRFLGIALAVAAALFAALRYTAP